MMGVWRLSDRSIERMISIVAGDWSTPFLSSDGYGMRCLELGHEDMSLLP